LEQDDGRGAGESEEAKRRAGWEPEMAQGSRSVDGDGRMLHRSIALAVK
jgi:hypothetical protein